MNLKNLLKSNITPIFSTQDLILKGEKIHRGQLSGFVKNRDLFRVKSGMFTLNPENLATFYIAFNLLQPSYISLESALYEYGISPDIVFNVTSITTKATKNFVTTFGTYIYKNLKKSLFFGYVKKAGFSGQITHQTLTQNTSKNASQNSNQPYLIAEPEKAVLDYLYLHKNDLHTQEDVDSLRFNAEAIRNLNLQKLIEYSKIFNNKKLNFLISCLPLNK